MEYTDDGDLWRALAICRAEAVDTKGAISAYREALALGTTPWESERSSSYNPNDIMILISKIYAKNGENKSALEWLKLGLKARYDDIPGLIDAPEYQLLKTTREFQQLLGISHVMTTSRHEGWLSDITYLRSKVAVLHSNPDHHSSALHLNKFLDKLIENIPSLSDEQITARITAFVGALGAGHDIFWPVDGLRGRLIPFALKFYQFSDGLYIIDAYEDALIGAKVDLVGDMSVENAYDIIRVAFPGDNDMGAKWHSVRHFAQPYTLEYLGVVNDAESATITVTLTSGEQRTILPKRRPFTPFTPALAMPKNGKIPLYLSKLNKNYWTQELRHLNALYVQVNLMINDEQESISQFAERIEQESSSPSIHNLILDLRHSPGGNGYLTPPLLRQLIRFNADPSKGELFVLIGRNTFSASQNLITDLDWIANPIFVGEPSGSKPNAYSESGRLQLPNSKFGLIVSSQFHQHSWPEDSRIWIAPDVPVTLTSKAYFAGRDPLIEAVQQIIQTNEQQ
ncbi:hypothetical protein NBRC116583_34510 [Arenicella sp. 4NH20-0111]